MGAEQSSPESQNFSLKIASAAEANRLLAEAEQIDGYRKKIRQNPMDAKARAAHHYFPLADSQVNITEIQIWLNNFIEIDLASQDFFKYFIKLPQFIRKKLEIYIINLQFSADAAMPHTRPLDGNRGLICIPGGLRGADWDKKTLLHEMVHIFQRLNPIFWTRSYKLFFHMEPFHGSIPEKYSNAIRYNPDTIPIQSLVEERIQSMVYTYKKKWVPLCIFTDITNPDIRATRIVYLNAENGNVYNELPSELLNDELLGDLQINAAMREHPNELVAWILAEPKRFSNNIFHEFLKLFTIS